MNAAMFSMAHRVWPCNMFTQNTWPMLFTKFYGNSTFMVIVWILVKNSGVHLGCLWQKHGAKKLAMSTEWMQDICIFSNVFPVSSGISSSVFLRKKKCPVLCTNILWEHISCFCSRMVCNCDNMQYNDW